MSSYTKSDYLKCLPPAPEGMRWEAAKVGDTLCASHMAAMPWEGRSFQTICVGTVLKTKADADGYFILRPKTSRKIAAKPDPLFGIVKSTLEISHFHKTNNYVPEYVISSLAKKYGVSEADLRKIRSFVQEKS